MYPDAFSLQFCSTVYLTATFCGPTISITPTRDLWPGTYLLLVTAGRARNKEIRHSNSGRESRGSSTPHSQRTLPRPTCERQKPLQLLRLVTDCPLRALALSHHRPPPNYHATNQIDGPSSSSACPPWIQAAPARDLTQTSPPLHPTP